MNMRPTMELKYMETNTEKLIYGAGANPVGKGILRELKLHQKFIDLEGKEHWKQVPTDYNCG